MTHSCQTCGDTFSSELKLELHRDTCGDDRLLCRSCGEQFDTGAATEDGWFYACPNEDCDAEGIGEDLVQLDEARIAASH